METNSTTIATMTSSELEEYAKEVEAKYKVRMRTLKALIRAKRAEEEATGPVFTNCTVLGGDPTE
jgi:hypothetical protein